MHKFSVQDGYDIDVNKVPVCCPICGEAYPHIYITAVVTEKMKQGGYPEHVEAIFQCGRDQCGHIFIAHYFREMIERNGRMCMGGLNFSETIPPTVEKPEVPDEIMQISPRFKEILDQATSGENYGLQDICGPGYRKALEFLIKDYCVKEDPDNQEAIKAKPLAVCIREHIDDINIKNCAERAAWLGNDETHYVRKWESKDIVDLKVLIKLTMSWIGNNIMTKTYLEDMKNR